MVETIEHLRREGYVGLALNFATFRAVLASEAGDRLVHRVEKWFLERMSDSMQIESLWTFNEKFQPEWHPRYACVRLAGAPARGVDRGRAGGVVLGAAGDRPLLARSARGDDRTATRVSCPWSTTTRRPRPTRPPHRRAAA